jgi:hypothetical protein
MSVEEKSLKKAIEAMLKLREAAKRTALEVEAEKERQRKVVEAPKPVR